MQTILDMMPRVDDHERHYPSRRMCGLVAFCGHMYPCYSYQVDYKTSEVFYDFESFQQYLMKRVAQEATDTQKTAGCRNCRAILEGFARSKLLKKVPSWLPFEHQTLGKESWAQFLKMTNLVLSDDVFRRAAAPIISAHYFNENHIEIEANPRLNAYAFAKVKDPYTARQEIEQYIGNNLAQQRDPEVHVSDEIRAESHGFDKHSFRRDPSKSKKRRKMRLTGS